MNKAIYISIKPKYVDKIVNKTKNYEFRNYIPKEEFNTLYVYVSYPVCKLKYIIDVEKIIEYPNKIDELCENNNLFNEGLLYKYAYKIGNIYEVNEIPLKELKEVYNFNPPQAFAYSKKYPLLTKKLEKLYSKYN